jgi:sigma-B regulation protein RsbU (phosphoserine phosphatase)
VDTLRLHIERPGTAAVDREFDTDSVVMGRSDKTDILLADHSVSRRHARLFFKGSEWLVEDLGSRNGTLLNGRAIAIAEPVHAGDVIRVGDALVRVAAIGTETAPHRPSAPSAPIAPAATDGSVFSILKPANELLESRAADAGASSRLQLLNEVHRALAAPISRAELLQMILDRAFAVLAPEHAAIFLKGANGELYQAAERRAPSASGTLVLSRRLAEEVTGKGAAALVLDAQVDERFANAQSILLSGVRSIVAAPLSDAESCMGMIALYSSIHIKRFSQEDLELLVSLASAAALRIRNIALADDAAERRVQDRELALAREFQMGMLRRRPPERPEVELAAELRPARSVGGDLYDFFVDGDRLWFVVGDVAGKGVAAAFMMAVAQTLCRAIAPSETSPATAVSRVNRELARDNDRAMFVTAFAGWLDLGTGRLQVVNAGHNLPYRIGRDGTVTVLAAKNALALGVLEDAEFPITEITLVPGDAIVLYTDGVCDAVNPKGAAFGTAGLEERLAALAAVPAGQIVRGVIEAVDLFAGTAPQEDDITVVAIRYRGTETAAR